MTWLKRSEPAAPQAASASRKGRLALLLGLGAFAVWLGFLSGLACLTSRPAALPRPQLQNADTVVEGRVLDKVATSSEPQADPDRIVTVRVEKTYQGKVEGPEIQVVFNRINGPVPSVSPRPSLFLLSHAVGGLYRPAPPVDAGTPGYYPVNRDTAKDLVRLGLR